MRCAHFARTTFSFTYVVYVKQNVWTFHTSLEKLCVRVMPRHLVQMNQTNFVQSSCLEPSHAAAVAKSRSNWKLLFSTSLLYSEQLARRIPICVHRTACRMQSSNGLHSLTSRSISRSSLLEKRIRWATEPTELMLTTSQPSPYNGLALVGCRLASGTLATSRSTLVWRDLARSLL